MPERTTITQVAQLGVETTPGVAVAANKLLTALSIDPAINLEATTFRPSGGKYATLAAPGKDFVEAKISSDVACYNHLAYLFSGILAYAAPVQQGTTTAYLWTFVPSQTAEDTIKTYTIEKGSAVRAGRFAYGLLNELTISFDREKIEISGTMLGQQYTDNVTLTANPTAVAAQPILPSALDVFIDNTATGIGTTKWTRVLSGELSISDRFAPVWTLNSAVTSFVAHVERAPKAQLKLLVEADAIGMSLLPAMRAGDKRYIRLKAVGPLIASTYYYTFQFDLCGVLSEVGEFSDEDGVYAIEWTFDVAFDKNWGTGKAMEAQLMNVLSAL